MYVQGIKLGFSAYSYLLSHLSMRDGISQCQALIFFISGVIFCNCISLRGIICLKSLSQWDVSITETGISSMVDSVYNTTHIDLLSE